MSEESKPDFLSEYLTWMKGPVVKFASLHIYNFGYQKDLPLPAISLNLENKMNFNLQSEGMQSPSRWSVVVIGQKYVERFDDVMEMVDRIHEDTHALPFAIFVQTEEELQLENVTSHITPSLVEI